MLVQTRASDMVFLGCVLRSPLFAATLGKDHRITDYRLHRFVYPCSVASDAHIPVPVGCGERLHIRLRHAAF